MNDAGKMSVWLPAVRAGSGADVFTMRLAAALQRHGVRASISWFPHWCESVPDLLCRARAPDGTHIIHVNSAYAFAFRRRGVPLVATEHHYVLDPAYRPYKSLAQHVYHRMVVGPYLRRSYAAADAIITDSRFTADVLARVVGVAVSRTIPLWVDYDKFSPATGPATPGTHFRLLFVGNLSRRKGFDVVPPLARRLGPGFEIRCAAGLRAGHKEEVANNITILGRLSAERLIEEYRACDAVLVPSRYEGFGYSALEAMACAKPVVGVRCGAVEEVVVDGETGLLCAVDDMDALEANCRRLAADPSLARGLGRVGRTRATSVFTESTGARAHIDLYRAVLAMPRGPA